MINIRRILFYVSCGWLGIGAFAGMNGIAEAKPRPLEIQDAVHALDFQVQGVVAAISPDGGWVASTVCDPRRRVASDNDKDGSSPSDDSRVGCDIWLTPIDGGPSRDLTLAEGNSWGPSWSPDGDRLVFTSDRDGEARLWMWDRRSDETRKVSDVITRTWLGMSVPLWTPDGRGLVVQLLPDGMTEEELEHGHGATRGAAEDAEPGSTVVILRSPRPAPNEADEDGGGGASHASHLLCDLGVVDVATGDVRRLLSRVRLFGARMSPDGRHVAYLDARGWGHAVGPIFALAALDLETGRSRDLATEISQEFPGAFSWSPDGRWIAYTAVPTRQPENDRFTSPGGSSGGGDLWVVAVKGGDPRRFAGAPEGALYTSYLAPLWGAGGRHLYAVGGHRLWRADVAAGSIEALTGEAPCSVRALVPTYEGNQVWSPDGGRSMVVMTRDEATKRDGFYSVDVAEGGAKPLLVEDREYGGIFDGPVTSPDGDQVVYVAGSSRQSPDLWVSNADFTGPRRLTDLNPQLERYTFGEGRLIEYRSADGEKLRAALLLPAGYQEGTRYPLVVWVYASDSGSRAVHRFGLVGYPAYNMQMLATRGYAVLWPDIPTRLGTPMLDLMKGVMPAIDRAVELGIADPDRLAVMGQSGGGYSTLALIVQTDRFKAAVMNAGYGDVVSMYGQMTDEGAGGWIPWLERRGGRMGAPPWEVPLRYVQNSPVFYLDRIQTPLIIQAGADDELIVPLSDEVWVGLQRLGKRATYLRYEGEGHMLTKAANLVDYWRRVLVFFDEHVKRAGADESSERE